MGASLSAFVEEDGEPNDEGVERLHILGQLKAEGRLLKNQVFVRYHSKIKIDNRSWFRA